MFTYYINSTSYQIRSTVLVIKHNMTCQVTTLENPAISWYQCRRWKISRVRLQQVNKFPHTSRLAHLVRAVCSVRAPPVGTYNYHLRHRKRRGASYQITQVGLRSSWVRQHQVALIRRNGGRCGCPLLLQRFFVHDHDTDGASNCVQCPPFKHISP